MIGKSTGIPFHKWDYPQNAGWFCEWKNPKEKWLMTGGTSILGNHQIGNGLEARQHSACQRLGGKVFGETGRMCS